MARGDVSNTQGVQTRRACLDAGRARRLLRSALIAAAMALPFVTAPGTSSAQDLRAVQIGTFEKPVFITAAPGKRNLLFVVEQAGRIRVMRREKLRARPFLDIRKIVYSPPDSGAGNEQGLLSMAFAPDYAKSGLFYVAFVNSKGDLEVDEFKRSPRSGWFAARSSRRKLMIVRHRKAQNHNGGQLAFGPDKMLYISTGDGGGGGDPWDNARNIKSLLGKILRIDPRRTKTRRFRIPRSNPFVGKAGRDEIFSYGLRNAWRFSFDRNRILIADVGQADHEEVNIVSIKRANGVNFGWPQYEGRLVFDKNRPGPGPAKFPMFVYNHDNGGCSITGGYVIRDPDLPKYKGRYIYGDLCTGDVRTFRIKRRARGDRSTGITLNGLTSFGKGWGGQIYMAQIGGAVSRLDPVAADAGDR